MNLSTNPFFTHGIEKLCTICRVILRDTDTSHSLFSTLEEFESPMNVLQVLQSFSNFYFYNGAQMVCTKCYGKTIEVYKFIQMCNKAHDNMQQNLKNVEANETKKDVEIDVKYEEISISPTRIIIDGREFLEETENETISKIDEMEIKIEEGILQEMEKEGTSSNEETTISHTEIVTEGRKTGSSNFDNLEVENINAQMHEHDERMGLIKSNDCHLVFSVKKELDDYRKETKRTKEKPFLSEMCNSICGTKYNLRSRDAKRSHISEHLRLNQDRHQSLRDHEDTHKRVHTGENSFTCDLAAQSSLLGDIYNVVEAHKCEQCERRFTRAQNLRSLMDIHNGVKAYKCEQCDRQFTQSEHLRTHMKIHNGVKTHKCEHCDRRFTRAQNLRSHMDIHNGVKAYKCEQCDRQFTQSGHLRTHMKIHNGVKAHKCAQCDQRFTRARHLRSHMEIHNGAKPYQCEQCDRRFTLAQNLRSHMDIHNGVKPYKCEQCDRRFTRAADLRRHMDMHNGVKAHKCEQCDRRFTLAHHLRSHMEYIHSGIKAHKCEQCDRQFTQASDLRRHMDIHNRVKTHKCE